ncbi:Hypothetical Protein FCC1311_033622 [Hondaea fermentalgiana]|uniref:Uncharacterized protein n=1 Tax=Hondaea fermentalgiana TaxID=2315210 RepID=A0A2R5GA13_9STRA|nr:Hypothetical Protein FCC1311_033622 [Hondaea fermentalgiana]|eukprot:GBG27139.1 Hypothetical Protein FCC1311_033622 [Hondaea fermentalgiana]
MDFAPLLSADGDEFAALHEHPDPDVNGNSNMHIFQRMTPGVGPAREGPDFLLPREFASVDWNGHYDDPDEDDDCKSTHSRTQTDPVIFLTTDTDPVHEIVKQLRSCLEKPDIFRDEVFWLAFRATPRQQWTKRCHDQTRKNTSYMTKRVRDFACKTLAPLLEQRGCVDLADAVRMEMQDERALTGKLKYFYKKLAYETFRRLSEDAQTAADLLDVAGDDSEKRAAVQENGEGLSVLIDTLESNFGPDLGLGPRYIDMHRPARSASGTFFDDNLSDPGAGFFVPPSSSPQTNTFQGHNGPGDVQQRRMLIQRQSSNNTVPDEESEQNLLAQNLLPMSQPKSSLPRSRSWAEDRRPSPPSFDPPTELVPPLMNEMPPTLTIHPVVHGQGDLGDGPAIGLNGFNNKANGSGVTLRR